MQHLLDNVVVGLLLLGSLVYATLALGPKSLRRRIASRLALLVPYLPVRLGMRRLAWRWSERLALKSAGSCGGCADCGSAVNQSAAQAVAQAAPSGEVRVPMTQIGRRDSAQP
jgi:hypothetical protein